MGRQSLSGSKRQPFSGNKRPSERWKCTEHADGTCSWVRLRGHWFPHQAHLALLVARTFKLVRLRGHWFTHLALLVVAVDEPLDPRSPCRTTRLTPRSVHILRAISPSSFTI